MEFPAPTLRRQPSSTNFLASHIPSHVWEGECPSVESIKFELEKYQALNILWSREFVSIKILQLCSANNTRLKDFKSLNPIPPSCFGLHIFHHPTQYNFLSSFFFSPPKFGHHPFKLITKIGRVFKVTHCISRYRQSYSALINI